MKVICDHNETKISFCNKIQLSTTSYLDIFDDICVKVSS